MPGIIVWGDIEAHHALVLFLEILVQSQFVHEFNWFHKWGAARCAACVWLKCQSIKIVLMSSCELMSWLWFGCKASSFAQHFSVGKWLRILASINVSMMSWMLQSQRSCSWLVCRWVGHENLHRCESAMFTNNVSSWICHVLLYVVFICIALQLIPAFCCSWVHSIVFWCLLLHGKKFGLVYFEFILHFYWIIILFNIFVFSLHFLRIFLIMVQSANNCKDYLHYNLVKFLWVFFERSWRLREWMLNLLHFIYYFTRRSYAVHVTILDDIQNIENCIRDKFSGDLLVYR